MTSPSSSPKACHYFVDEAGDGTLFSTHGQVIVGNSGCSSHFFVGMLKVADPVQLLADLTDLRKNILADSFFRRVPSISREAKKTALLFHAKDDLPEVRRDVFKILRKHDLCFFAIVRDKRVIARKVLDWSKRSRKYHYHPNLLYDVHVGRLFKDRLRDEVNIRAVFATRGTTGRTAALEAAIVQARTDFRHEHGVASTCAVEVTACPSTGAAGLQAVDYFLWALQRLYTRQEDRYLDFLYPAVGVIRDVDDLRDDDKGVSYDQNNRLTAEKIKKTPGI
jgi:hypothetical protein